MFLDTSVVVELLLNETGSKRFEQIFSAIKAEPVFISLVQLGEVSDWCLANQLDPPEVLSRLKEIVEIVPLTEQAVLHGSRLKQEMRSLGASKFSLLDGLILAGAMELGETLLTFDGDFRHSEMAVVLE